MKAQTEAAGSAIDKASQEATVMNVGTIVSFVWGKDGVDYRYSLEVEKLPFGNGLFMSKLLQLAGGSVTHRSKAALAALPTGGTITTEMFVSAVLAAEFRGDEKPSKDDVAEGQKLLNSVTAGTFKSAEEVVGKIKAKYGWEVTPDLNGFAMHALYLRKQAEAKRAAELEAKLAAGDV